MAEAFLCGNGGDNPLNFKVVGGTSAPSNPKENMIWVNTDAKITGWQFCAKYLGKNLLENTAQSQTINGVTFTVNVDKSVTVNGTATDTVVFHLTSGIKLEKGKNYIASGCPPGGGSNTFSFRISDGASVQYGDTGWGASISGFEHESAQVFIRIWSGTICENLIFYPMIRLASENDGTYEPYGSGKEGAVWITTDSHSSVEFNALKKNGIQIYPASAKQYVSGKWVDKTAKIYQGGKWVDWTAYLYLQKGNAVNVAVYNAKVGTIVPNASSVSYKFEQYTGNYWHFGPVDMTNYKILHVDVVGGSVFGNPKPGICVFPNKITSHQTTNITFFGGSYTNATCTVPKQTIAMDISAYSGNQYVILDFEGTNTGTGYVEISNIYLEN